jgi:hypothetical protein
VKNEELVVLQSAKQTSTISVGAGRLQNCSPSLHVTSPNKNHLLEPVSLLFAIAKKEIEKYAPRHWRSRHEDSDMRENVIFPQDNFYPTSHHILVYRNLQISGAAFVR